MSIESLIATQASRTAGPPPMQQLSNLQSLKGQQLSNQGQELRNTAGTEALSQDKRQRGLEFAANVGQQLKAEQDPIKKAQTYSAALQFAKMNGHDISAFPQQYDDRAQLMLDVAHGQVYGGKEFEALLRKTGISLNQKEFNNHVETLRPAIGPDGKIDPEKLSVAQKASAIELGLLPRATGSAAITAATTKGLTDSVAESQGTIKKAEGYGSESGKLIAQSEIKPQVEAAIATAKAEVANASKISMEDRSNQRAYQTYKSAMGNLVSAMGGTNTGPISGRLPAVSADAQIAEGAVAAMAPVLKGIFRIAGEGTFTDKDQELLLNMVPTRKDHPEATKAKVAAIDAIVESKIGSRSAASATSQGGPQAGTEEEGYRFKGGDPSDPNNWEKI